MYLLKTIPVIVLLLSHAALAQPPRPNIKVLVIDTTNRQAVLDRTAEASDQFLGQLTKIEHFHVATPKSASLLRSEPPAEVKEALGRAKSLIRKGKESLLNISLDDAAEAFQSARVIYRKNMAWLDDPEPLIMALMGLAEALATMGNKEEARFSYKEVLCLNPDYEPDPGQVPTKLRTMFEEVRQEVSQHTGGQLSIQVQPEGAKVLLDGLTIGKSPLLKEDLPPGLHFLKVTKDGFRPLRKVVEIKGGQTARVEENLKPLLALELIRRLRTALAKDSVKQSLELARDLARMMELDAVICSQLAETPQSISPVFSVVIIPASGKPGKLAARLPEKNSSRVLQALALQVSDTLDEGSAPLALSPGLGLDFDHSLLGIPKTLEAPTVVHIPPGMDTKPSKDKYPWPEKGTERGASKTATSIWKKWWLWTGVGAVIAGGIATTLALTLGGGQKTIKDPDRILIRLDTSQK